MPARPLIVEPSQTSNSTSESAQPVTAPPVDKARKWMWMILGALVAMQMYFVRELLAALLLFTVGFAVLGALVLAVYGIRKAGGRSLAGTRRVRLSALAIVEDLSRKLLRRPRSEPAR